LVRLSLGVRLVLEGRPLAVTVFAGGAVGVEKLVEPPGRVVAVSFAVLGLPEGSLAVPPGLEVY